MQCIAPNITPDQFLPELNFSNMTKIYISSNVPTRIKIEITYIFGIHRRPIQLVMLIAVSLSVHVNTVSRPTWLLKCLFCRPAWAVDS